MSFPRRTARTLPLVLVLAAGAADPGSAQDSLSFFPRDARLAVVPAPVRPLALQPDPAPVVQVRDSLPAPTPGIGAPVRGALVGATVGALVFGYGVGHLAASTARWEKGEAAFGGMILGAAVGIVLGAPVGAHAFDEGQGNLGAAMAGSLVGGGTLLLAGLATKNNLLVLQVPAGALIGAVVGEVNTRRR